MFPALFPPILFSTILSSSMTDSRRFKFSLWLSIVGALVSLLSLYHHVEVRGGFSRGPSFCSISKSIDCDAVVRSSYAEFIGIPLGAWGLIFYLSFLLLSLGWEERREFRKDAAFVLAFAASVASIALLYISHRYVGAVCLICIAMYSVNFLLLAVHLRGDPLSALGRGIYTIGVRYPSALFNYGPEGKKAFRVFLAFAVIVTISFSLPFLIHKGFAAVVGKRPTAIKAWETKPVQEIRLTKSGVGRDYSKGEGRIHIVEFADLECPACRRLYGEMERIVEENKSDVTFTFRNYPLDKECNSLLPESIHLNACFAAAFSRCAGEQDKFWDALHFVMTNLALEDPNLSSEAIKNALLQGIAVLSLDSEAMRECMESKRTSNKLKDDVSEGNRLGLKGTPTVWINGKRLDDPDYKTITDILKHILK